jgi:WD40 repeat protein
MRYVLRSVQRKSLIDHSGQNGDIIFWNAYSGLEVDRLQNDCPASLVAWVLCPSSDVEVILACALEDGSVILWSIQPNYVPSPNVGSKHQCLNRFVPYPNSFKISVLVSERESLAISAGGVISMYRFKPPGECAFDCG